MVTNCDMSELSTPLVLSFIHYKQEYDSADKRALVKIICLCGASCKYITMISSMYERDIARE